jgi:hypothetical protein
MSKTLFSSKVEILSQVWVRYKSDSSRSEGWLSFFDWNDVGLPMAYLAFSEFVTIKRDKKYFIEETWVSYCEVLGIDPDEKYLTVEDTFNESRKAKQG